MSAGGVVVQQTGVGLVVEIRSVEFNQGLIYTYVVLCPNEETKVFGHKDVELIA
jgi:hypothetical protein